MKKKLNHEMQTCVNEDPTGKVEFIRRAAAVLSQLRTYMHADGAGVPMDLIERYVFYSSLSHHSTLCVPYYLYCGLTICTCHASFNMYINQILHT
jgi:hypothetical protein